MYSRAIYNSSLQNHRILTTCCSLTADRLFPESWPFFVSEWEARPPFELFSKQGFAAKSWDCLSRDRLPSMFACNETFAESISFVETASLAADSMQVDIALPLHTMVPLHGPEPSVAARALGAASENPEREHSANESVFCSTPVSKMRSRQTNSKYCQRTQCDWRPLLSWISPGITSPKGSTSAKSFSFSRRRFFGNLHPSESTCQAQLEDTEWNLNRIAGHEPEIWRHYDRAGSWELLTAPAFHSRINVHPHDT